MSDEICGDVCASDPGGELPCVREPGHDGSHQDARDATWAQPRRGMPPARRDPEAMTAEMHMAAIWAMEHVQSFELKIVRGGPAAFSEGIRGPVCAWKAMVRGVEYGLAQEITGDVAPVLRAVAEDGRHTLERLADS